MINTLAPQGIVAPPGAPPGAAPPPPGNALVPSSSPFDATAMDSQLDSHIAKHEQLSEFSRRAAVIRNGLDALRAKMDTVNIDDITSEAATMVGEGADPRQMATILASMPTSGNSGELQNWVAQLDAKFTYAEHQIELQRRLAAHQMAVHGLRTLAGHELEAGAPNAPQGFGAAGAGGTGSMGVPQNAG